jgi:outer membrane protein assembly complex protein YaeT
VPAQPARQTDNPPVRKRRVLRTAARLGGGACLFGGLLLLALHSGPARRFALNRAIAFLASRQIELRTDELRYNLLSLSVDLRDLQLRSAASADLPVFARIGRARVDLSLPELLRGRMVVETGLMEDVDVDYIVGADGRDNLPRLPGNSDEARRPPDYLISSLSASRVRVRYANLAQRVDVVVSLSSAGMTGNPLTGRHQIRIESADGRIQVRNHAAAVDRIAGVLDLGQDDVRVDRLQIEALGSRADGAGLVHEFDAPKLGLTLHASIDAARAAAFLGVPDPVGGTVVIDATVRGPLSAPAIDTRVSGSDLRFRSLGAAQLDVRAAYDALGRSAELSAARLQAPWGRVAASGRLALDREHTSRVRAQIDDVTLAAVMHGLNLPYAVQTRIDGNLDADWPGLDYREASGRGTATLTPITAQAARRAMPLGGYVSARRSQGTTDADLRQITAAGAQVTGRVRIDDDGRLEGELHASAPDVARTASDAETFLARGPLLPAPVSGAAIIDARLGGTVVAPTADVSVSSRSVSIGAATGVAIGADLVLTTAALTIARGDVTWGSARAGLTGTIGLQGRQPLDLVLGADAADLRALLGAAYAKGAPVSGTVGAHGTVRGTVARPLGTFAVTGADMVAFGETFGSLNAAVALAGRDITLTRLVVEKPQPDGPGRITAIGSYNLNRKAYSLDLQSENVQLLALTLPGGQRIGGKLELSAKGAGSITSPAGSASLSIDSLEVDGLRTPSTNSGNAPPPLSLGRIVMAATAANHEAVISASAQRFDLDGNAVVGLARPWRTTLRVRANDSLLERLPLNVRAPYDGRLRATLDAAGDLAQPGRGRATADIEALSGSWNGQPFTVTSARPLRYENQRLTIDGLELTARDSSLKVTGELPLTAGGAAGDVTIEARADLATLAQYLPRDTSVSGDGVATLAGTLRGTLDSITPDFVVTVENGAVLSPRLAPGASNIQLLARVAGGAAQVERLTGRWGGATLEASGTIPLDVLPKLPVEIPRRGGPATITAFVRGLDPATIPGVPAGVTGRLGVDLDASAARADLTALEGHITFQQLDLAFNRLTLSQQEPSRISVDSGMATVERLALSGSAGTVSASGTAGLAGDRALDLKVDGSLNVAALSEVATKVRTEGTATWKLAAHGTTTAPELNGTIDLADATVASDDLNIAAVNVVAHADVEGTRLNLTKLAGEVNGGAFEGAGSVTAGNGSISDIDLQVSVRDFAYDAPLDLRSLSDSTIRVIRRGDQFVVAGQVTINEAGLTTDINFDEGLFAAIGAPRTLDLAEVRNPLLERVRFNIDVDTATPVVIENNLARAEIDTDLRIVGTPYEPGLTGRITLAEGGQVTLNARRYEVERGVITFVDDRRIVPSIDLALNTKASNYDVRIALTGTPGKTETSWTSEPPLPEPDIMALLVTGRTVDEMRGEESEVARVQALSYLTGRLGSKFGRGLEQATGISEVRIEPVLIANETDPTARLTIGQNLTDQVKLVYSTNLADSNDQIWVAEYDVTRRFQIRAVREREDDSYRGDFRHDVRFGGDPSPRRQLRHRPAIASLTVTTDGGTDEAVLRKLLELKKGDTYDYFAARKGLERIDEHHLEAGYLQSRVRLERAIEADKADLTLRATRGPLVELHFEGPMPPSKIQREVRTAWHHGVFDRQRGNDSVQALRAWLIRERYLQAQVEYDIGDQPDRRRVVFRIQPGPRYDKIVVAFEGASGIGPDRLDKIIEDQRLERQLFTDPGAVTDLLQRYYREQGYLSVEIDAPRYEFNGTNARVVLAVREGGRFAVGQVTTAGNRVFTSAEIIATVPLTPGAPFVSAAAEHAFERIRELYWRKGYNDVHSEYALVVDRSAARVDVGFTIVEGRQSVVAGIAVEGNRRTSERLVRGQLEMAPSEPLDLAVLARSRRNLYGTGAFSIADITRETRESDETAASGPAPDLQGGGNGTRKPVDLNVSVREVQPVQLRYGLSYDTESGLGGILDLSLHNMLGKARVFGMQGRYDSEIHDARVYVSQPSLRSWPRKTTASVYFREDLNPPTEQTDPFDISRQGASIQQQAQFRKFYVWSYGYRYELATTLEPSLGVGVTETVRVTPLSTTLTRETRDEVLDASKGTFLSQAFAYSPSWLGSDRPYVKYYGQYFHYFPLRPERPKPLSSEVLRSRLVFAAGARIGLARGLGGEVPTSERFYAGGSTTLRGFEQNAVGPIGVNDVPAGGNAVFVANSELRMPLVRFLDGALFVDIGNVYPTISDFSLTDLRESAGVGIRIRTPWVLLRSDYGWVLDPRPGERRSRFYFSIGQAF